METVQNSKLNPNSVEFIFEGKYYPNSCSSVENTSKQISNKDLQPKFDNNLLFLKLIYDGSRMPCIQAKNFAPNANVITSAVDLDMFNLLSSKHRDGILADYLNLEKLFVLKDRDLKLRSIYKLMVDFNVFEISSLMNNNEQLQTIQAQHNSADIRNDSCIFPNFDKIRSSSKLLSIVENSALIESNEETKISNLKLENPNTDEKTNEKSSPVYQTSRVDFDDIKSTDLSKYIKKLHTIDDNPELLPYIHAMENFKDELDLNVEDFDYYMKDIDNFSNNNKDEQVSSKLNLQYWNSMVLLPESSAKQIGSKDEKDDFDSKTRSLFNKNLNTQLDKAFNCNIDKLNMTNDRLSSEQYSLFQNHSGIQRDAISIPYNPAQMSILHQIAQRSESRHLNVLQQNLINSTVNGFQKNNNNQILIQKIMENSNNYSNIVFNNFQNENSVPFKLMQNHFIAEQLKNCRTMERNIF